MDSEELEWYRHPLLKVLKQPSSDSIPGKEERAHTIYLVSISD